MTLAHPALTTSGESKIKQKFRTANDAQTARQNDENWKELQKRWGIESEQKKKARALSAPDWNPAPVQYRGSDHPKVPSKHTSWDNCVKAPTPVYSGSACIGIGQLHKSNAVPIFSKEEAIDISKMRR